MNFNSWCTAIQAIHTCSADQAVHCAVHVLLQQHNLQTKTCNKQVKLVLYHSGQCLCSAPQTCFVAKSRHCRSIILFLHHNLQATACIAQFKLAQLLAAYRWCFVIQANIRVTQLKLAWQVSASATAAQAHCDKWCVTPIHPVHPPPSDLAHCDA